MAKITYLEDIVDELTEEYGIDRKQIEEICKLNIKYINKLTKTPEVISIFIPKLGVLHFNAGRAKYSYRNSNTFRNYHEVIGSQIDMVNDVLADEKDLVHDRRSYFTIFKKFFYKDKELRKKSTKAELFKKLETKQNNLMK
jgi:hypothetical protein